MLSSKLQAKLKMSREPELEMRMVNYYKYQEMATYLNTTPLARYLVMSNGRRIGWRSNRRCYLNPIAYKVATGKDLK